MKAQKLERGASVEKLQSEIIVDFCNTIDYSFWEEHPRVLDEEAD
ncbi:hypothetical protein SLEP1_g34685 [Rubroshorea leprosula]|uniref:Uncharacterized protein n=1 Tax=Rubroshorea leprosula TaxID=152421 RepID=A0AAV5KKS7_9ROSI|nr:hypothetical protein SLEP1_g34685 [Rubroshorea leprosula]